LSQLLVRGRRNTCFGALPKSPLAGSAKAAALIHCGGPIRPLLSVTGFRSLLSNVGSPNITRRDPSPPPVMSVLFVVVKPTPLGVPLAKAVIPDNCQSSKTALTTLLSHSRVARGRSYVYLMTTTSAWPKPA